MRKLLLFLCFSVFQCTEVSAQLFLAQTWSKDIYLVNYVSDENVNLNLPDNELAGYQIQNDTLIVFLGNLNGQLKSYRVYHEWLKTYSSTTGNSIDTPGTGYLLSDKGSISLKYAESKADSIQGWMVQIIKTAPDFELTVDKCSNLNMFKKGRHLWDYHSNHGFMGLGCFTSLDGAETIKLSEGKILFVKETDTILLPRKFSVIEIDQKTGKPKQIIKSKLLVQAAYTPDGKYIYYGYISKNGYRNFYKYNRETGKKKLLSIDNGKYKLPVQNLFWLN